MSATGARRFLARRPALAGVALLAATWMVTVLAHPWDDEGVSDLGSRSGVAEMILDGELPYSDFAFEYPPLAAPAIALPGLVGTAEDDYRLGIGIMTFLLAAATLLLVGALARRTGGAAWPAVLGVAAAPLLLGAVIRVHFDLVAVVLTLAALLALLERRPGLGLGLLALGAMTKGFPLVAAPVALAWLWAEGDRSALRRGAVALFATLAVIGIAWVAYSPDGAREALEFQLERPVQIESSPASVLLGVDEIGGPAAEIVHSHATAGLENDLEGPMGVVFAALLAGAVLVAAALVTPVRRGGAADSRPGSSPALAIGPVRARALVLGTLAAVAAFAAFGRVLSPQFLVWVVPLLALALAWRMWALGVACATACALTQVEFPSRYFDLIDGEPFAVAVTAARNLALVAAVALALVGMWRLPGSAQRCGSSTCSIERARPPGSASITTAFSQGSSSEVSNRIGVIVRNRLSACSRLTPITPPRGPVMPTSVT